MSKYKLYIRQYDITTNDYKVREEIVETNDVYHEIGKIYSTAFTEIKRIDYQKIDETKELKKEIERLNNIIKQYDKVSFIHEMELQKRIDKAIEYIEDNAYWGEETEDGDFVSGKLLQDDEIDYILEILNKGESND